MSLTLLDDQDLAWCRKNAGLPSLKASLMDDQANGVWLEAILNFVTSNNVVPYFFVGFVIYVFRKPLGNLVDRITRLAFKIGNSASGQIEAAPPESIQHGTPDTAKETQEADRNQGVAEVEPEPAPAQPWFVEIDDLLSKNDLEAAAAIF